MDPLVNVKEESEGTGVAISLLTLASLSHFEEYSDGHATQAKNSQDLEAF